MRSFLLLATFATMAATPAAAVTFGEIPAWCAPADKGGRPALCEGHLESGLRLLASSDPMLHGDNPACVPAGEDRAQIIGLMQDHARRHPESRDLDGVDGRTGAQGPLPVPVNRSRSCAREAPIAVADPDQAPAASR